MKKFIAMSILTIVCCLFSINNVKAEIGEGKIGEKTQYCIYCNGKKCYSVVLDMTKNAIPRVFQTGQKTEEIEFNPSVLSQLIQQFTGGSNKFLSYKYNVGEGCPNYLHYFVIEKDQLGPINYDSYNYYITNSSDISDYIDKTADSYSSWAKFLSEGKYIGKIKYELKFSYGIDSTEQSSATIASYITPIYSDFKARRSEELKHEDVGCAILTPPILEKLNWAFNIIKYVGSILAILLGSVDFLKAVFSDEDKATNKAAQKFLKRIIAAILIFLLPLMIQFVLNNVEIEGFNKDAPTCGIGISEE